MYGRKLNATKLQMTWSTCCPSSLAWRISQLFAISRLAMTCGAWVVRIWNSQSHNRACRSWLLGQEAHSTKASSLGWRRCTLNAQIGPCRSLSTSLWNAEESLAAMHDHLSGFSSSGKCLLNCFAALLEESLDASSYSHLTNTSMNFKYSSHLEPQDSRSTWWQLDL